MLSQYNVVLWSIADKCDELMSHLYETVVDLRGGFINRPTPVNLTALPTCPPTNNICYFVSYNLPQYKSFLSLYNIVDQFNVVLIMLVIYFVVIVILPIT